MPMEIKLTGTCEFNVYEGVSMKNGKPYTLVKIKFKDYELYSGIMINQDQLKLIEERVGGK